MALEEQLASMYDVVLHRMSEIKIEYRGSEIEPRYLEKARLILTAPSADEGHRLAEKAFQAYFVHLLYLWSQGKIEGKDTLANIERKVKQAESLANFLDTKGLAEQAESQRQRADEIRRRSLTLDKDDAL